MKNNYQKKYEQPYTPKEIVTLYRKEHAITRREYVEMLEENLEYRLFGSHRDYQQGKINEKTYCDFLSTILNAFPVNNDEEVTSKARKKVRT